MSVCVYVCVTFFNGVVTGELTVKWKEFKGRGRGAEESGEGICRHSVYESVGNQEMKL